MLVDLMVSRANNGHNRMDVHRHATFSRSLGRMFKGFWRLFH